jgi:acyl dehydratase
MVVMKRSENPTKVERHSPGAAPVQVGTTLPELSIPVTRTLVIAAAIATRDYQDVHHDHELARARGSKDIFMNILTTNGLVGRFITDWAGPASRLRRTAIRLGAPNHPGDTMVMSGEVVAVDGAIVDVAVRGVNSLGTHVHGTVSVEMPVRA